MYSSLSIALPGIMRRMATMEYWSGKEIVGAECFAPFLVFIDSTPISHHPISLPASL